MTISANVNLGQQKLPTRKRRFAMRFAIGSPFILIRNCEGFASFSKGPFSGRPFWSISGPRLGPVAEKRRDPASGPSVTRNRDCFGRGFRSRNCESFGSSLTGESEFRVSSAIRNYELQRASVARNSGLRVSELRIYRERFAEDS